MPWRHHADTLEAVHQLREEVVTHGAALIRRVAKGFRDAVVDIDVFSLFEVKINFYDIDGKGDVDPL